MSASIYWKPTGNGSSLDLGSETPSSFMETIKKVFGNFPCTLGEDELEKLQVLASLHSTGDYSNDPYTELIALIEKSGEISIWATY